MAISDNLIIAHKPCQVAIEGAGKPDKGGEGGKHVDRQQRQGQKQDVPEHDKALAKKRLEFLNLSGIVNCVTKSLNCSPCLCLCLSLCQLSEVCQRRLCESAVLSEEDAEIKSGSQTE